MTTTYKRLQLSLAHDRQQSSEVSANKIVTVDVEWSVFAGMCIDLAEAISHEKHSRTTSGTKPR